MRTSNDIGSDAKSVTPGKNHPVPWRSFLVVTTLLLLAFALPLYRLVRFAFGSDLYSHVLLIPFISAYLVWIRRRQLPPAAAPVPAWALIPLAAGLAALGGYARLEFAGHAIQPADALALTTAALVLLFWAVCLALFDPARLRALAFPLGFLIFMVPFPTALRTWLDTSLQDGSAVAAQAFFSSVGTPVLRAGTFFQLPGFSLEIAPECSGIHSSLALFITSVLAGYFFLRSPWKRGVLAGAVIPLALLRNGFRVFVIGELCVHVGPQMINSPIHRQGGPLFFALSLIPLFLVLYLLVRSERQRATTT